MLSELQQRRFNGSDGGVSWSPMDDELLAQPQVMKLLDSLREQYTRYQEVCRQRSKRTQLEEIQQKVMQVGVLFEYIELFLNYESCFFFIYSFYSVTDFILSFILYFILYREP